MHHIYLFYNSETTQGLPWIVPHPSWTSPEGATSNLLPFLPFPVLHRHNMPTRSGNRAGNNAEQNHREKKLKGEETARIVYAANFILISKQMEWWRLIILLYPTPCFIYFCYFPLNSSGIFLLFIINDWDLVF